MNYSASPTYAFTGIRRSAALALTFQDYDKKTKTITVPNCKNRSEYQIPVSQILEKILEKYLAGRPHRHQSKSSYLFLSSRTGGALSKRSVNKRFEKWKNMAGIPGDLTIHSFRSGFATELYRQTKDAVLISKSLDHYSMNSTLRYISHNSDYLRTNIDFVYSNQFVDLVNLY